MKQRVLFLCTGNSCRSQMAEGLLRHFGGDRYEVHSAGTDPSSVNPRAIAAMEEVDIDISAHTSKGVRQFYDQPFDVVVTVCDHAHQICPTFPNAKTSIHWSIDDPFHARGGDEAIHKEFGRVRDDLLTRIRAQFLDGKPNST